MSLEANLSKLPEACYAVSESSDLVQIHRNQSGYFLSALSSLDEAKNRALADQLNANLSVTKAQEQAMYVGSMFGWDVPGADPDRYTEQGLRKADPASPVFEDDERAYILNEGEYYLHIQAYADYYDYTIYQRDFSEYDGGQLDDTGISMDETVQSILERIHMQDLPREEYDLDQLQRSVDEVAIAQLKAARAAHGIPTLGEQIAEAQKRSAQQNQQQGMRDQRKEPERL